MKIYLAGPYAEMTRMLEWEHALLVAGHACTARWIRGNEEGMTQVDAAQMDLDDVDAADALVLMAFPRSTKTTGGGRYVEFGYALARNKMVIAVCAEEPAENVFHHLPQVVRCKSIEAAMEYLK